MQRIVWKPCNFPDTVPVIVFLGMIVSIAGGAEVFESENTCTGGVYPIAGSVRGVGAKAFRDSFGSGLVVAVRKI